MLRIAIVGCLALSACSAASSIERPSLPPMTDGAAYQVPTGPVVTSPSSVQIGGDVFQVKALSGPVDLNGVPVCQAVRAVVSDSLGAASSCTAQGSIWFQTGRDIPAAEVFRAFVLVLKRSGLQVSTAGGVVTVAGDVGEFGGLVGPESIESPLVEPLGGGAHRFTGESIPDAARVVSDVIRLNTGGAVIESFRGNDQDAQALQALAQDAGYTVKAVSDGRRVFLSGSANEVALIRAASRSEEEKTVSLRVGAVDPGTVQALQAAFPDLRISHDPARSVFYVRGFGGDLEQAMPALRSHISEPQQVRLDAAFVEWSSRSDQTFSSALEGSRGRFGLSLGQSSDGNAITVGQGLNAVLSAVESLGSSSVLATPSLTVLDGRSARFVSGDQVPFVTETTDKDGDTVQSIEYRDTGVVLNVTASHASDGTIRITARIEITSVRDAVGVGGNPIFSTRLVETSLRVTSGQSVVISGLALDNASASSAGFPLVSRAGVLGSRKRSQDRSEMLFIMTPRLLPSQGSALRAQ